MPDTQAEAAVVAEETTMGNRAPTGSRHRNQNRGNNRNNNVHMETEDRNYEGDTPGVGGILALKTEKITKKLTFDAFREKLTTYVNKEFSHATDVVCIVKHLKDPNGTFDDKNKPTKLSDENQKSPIERMIQDQEIKQFVYKKQTLKNNINKIYAIVWGQCTSGVQSVLKGEEDFEEREEDVDCLWLLKSIKKITAGIDNKDNKQYTLHESIMCFFTMRQGETESNDSYLNRFKSNIQNLELVGGSNFLYSAEHVEAKGATLADSDKKRAKEQFLAMCF